MYLVRRLSALSCCSAQEEEGVIVTDWVPMSAKPLRGKAMPLQVSGNSLCEAAASGNVDIVVALLRRKADVNAAAGPEVGPEACGMTALTSAARNGHSEVVAALLVDDIVNVNAMSSGSKRQTPLMWACQNGHTAVVKQLLTQDGADVNAVNPDGFVALMMAAENGHAACLQALLQDTRTDRNRRLIRGDSSVTSPFTVAVAEGHLDCVRLLITARADVDELLGGEETALGCATRLMRSDMLAVLLEAHADPSIENENGVTPLQQAQQNCDTEAVLRLLVAGARSEEGLSALRRAQLLGDAEEARRILRECPAIIHSPEESVPPVHLATIRLDVESVRSEVRRLLCQGGNVEVRDGGQLLAVFYAFELGSEEVIRRLLLDAHGFSQPFVDAVLLAVPLKATKRNRSHRDHSRSKSTGEELMKGERSGKMPRSKSTKSMGSAGSRDMTDWSPGPRGSRKVSAGSSAANTSEWTPSASIAPAGCDDFMADEVSSPLSPLSPSPGSSHNLLSPRNKLMSGECSPASSVGLSVGMGSARTGSAADIGSSGSLSLNGRTNTKDMTSQSRSVVLVTNANEGKSYGNGSEQPQHLSRGKSREARFKERDLGCNSCKALHALLATSLQYVHQADAVAPILRSFVGSMMSVKYLMSQPTLFESFRTACTESAAKLRKSFEDEAGENTMVALQKIGRPTAAGTGACGTSFVQTTEAFVLQHGGTSQTSTAMSLALLSMAIDDVFREDLTSTLKGLTDEIIWERPRSSSSLQRMVQKHQELPLIRRPPLANIDLLRAVASISKPDDADLILKALESRYRILQVTNSHSQASSSRAGIIVRFSYEPGLSLAHIFGKGSYDKELGKLVASSDRAEHWLRFVQHLPGTYAWLRALHGLWRASASHPSRAIQVTVELLIIHSSHSRGWKLLEMLTEIGSATSPLDLASRFVYAFEETDDGSEQSHRRVAMIAEAARREKVASTLADRADRPL